MKRLMMAFAAILLGITLLSPGAQALNYATFQFDELLEQADAVIIGKIIKEPGKVVDSYSTYKVNVEKSLVGDLQVDQGVDFVVLHWSDEGKLYKGNTYLLLLSKQLKNGAEYGIAGVHQGFIQLLPDGEITSRFYEKAEITAYLDEHGVSSSTWITDIPAASEGRIKGKSSGAMQLTVVIVALGLIGVLALAARRR